MQKEKKLKHLRLSLTCSMVLRSPLQLLLISSHNNAGYAKVEAKCPHLLSLSVLPEKVGMNQQ